MERLNSINSVQISKAGTAVLILRAFVYHSFQHILSSKDVHAAFEDAGNLHFKSERIEESPKMFEERCKAYEILKNSARTRIKHGRKNLFLV